MTIGAPAAGFVQRYRSRLFSSTPVLFTAVEQRRIAPASVTANDAVVAISIDLPGVVENILRLLPETEKLAIVIGNSPLERASLEQLRGDLQRFANRVTFEWYNELSFDEMLKRAAALGPRSAIFFVLLTVDAAGVAQDEGNALTQLYAVANAPIFSYVDAFFGRGIVGGPLISVSDVSQQAAGVAIRMLGGEKGGDIKTPPIGFAAPEQYDWREMQRWGITEARLPPESEIRFRDPTIWELYRWQIFVIAIALLFQSVLIGGLLYEHWRRRKVEVEARRLLLELAHMNRYATAGELSASIAHELNQPLGAILNNAEAGEMILNSPSPDLKEVQNVLADIRRDDRRASEVIRRLWSLHKKTPLETQDVNISETVREVCAFMSGLASARNVTLSTALAPQTLLVKGDHIQLQQVILNLVVNGIDAASTNGKRGIVTCMAQRNGVSAEISITDSGPGVPLDKLEDVFEPFFTTKKSGMGMGLSVSRTIIQAHGGRIWAENQGNAGAVFRFNLPLAKAN